MKCKCALLWIVSTLFAIEAVTLGLYEGDACKTHDGQSGICKLATTCNWLQEQLNKKIMTFSQIILCGFEGETPIACCRDNGPTKRPTLTTPFIFNSVSNEVDFNFSSTEETNNVPRFDGVKITQACAEYTRTAIPPLTDNIIEGRAVLLREYPHMAALGYLSTSGNISFDCGGTLISDQWVVTAAHCVTKSRTPTLIRMGVVWLDQDEEPPVDRAVIETNRHPAYNASLKQNDIALLKLDRPVEFSDRVRPACIRTQTEDVSETTELIIAGWGSIRAKQYTQLPLLQKANVTIIPFDTCNATLLEYNNLANQPALRNGLLPSQLCALDTSSPPDKIADACVGDSGGPIFTHEPPGISTIVGIVSFGVSCATRLPSVYTRIASYTSWIESIVWAK